MFLILFITGLCCSLYNFIFSERITKVIDNALVSCISDSYKKTYSYNLNLSYNDKKDILKICIQNKSSTNLANDAYFSEKTNKWEMYDKKQIVSKEDIINNLNNIKE